MATNLAKNVIQAVNDFHDIKEKIKSKGISLPIGTKTSEYADKIGQLKLDTLNWLNIDFNDAIVTGAAGLDNIYEHSNGIDIYLYTTNNFPNAYGLWHINRSEGICRRIYDEGFNWSNFFEASDGTLYISSKSNASLGILSVSGGSASLILDIGYYWSYIIEDGKANIYCASSISSFSGIYKLTTTSSEQIYDSGYKWRFIEGANNYVYAGADNDSSLGLLCLNEGVATVIHSETKNWINHFCAKNGDVYISSNLQGTNGILYVRDGVATKIYHSTPHWRYFYESKDGYVFMATSTSNTGIVSAKDGVATRIVSAGHDFQYYYETENGDIYATSYSVSTVLHIKNNVATTIEGISASGSFRYYFETSGGELYVGNSSTGLGYGLMHLSGTVGTMVFTEGSAWRSFYEDLNGNVYVGTSNSSSMSYGTGIYKLEGVNAVKIYEAGFGWSYKYEVDGYVYYTNSNSVNATRNFIVRINGDIAEELFLKV